MIQRLQVDCGHTRRIIQSQPFKDEAGRHNVSLFWVWTASVTSALPWYTIFTGIRKYQRLTHRLLLSQVPWTKLVFGGCVVNSIQCEGFLESCDLCHTRVWLIRQHYLLPLPPLVCSAHTSFLHIAIHLMKHTQSLMAYPEWPRRNTEFSGMCFFLNE